jgi:hypothetical protein
MTRKTALTHPVLQKIKSSPWIQDDFKGYEIGLHQADNPYKIFEAVFVNVSATLYKPWKEIYNAKEYKTESFAQLCVASVLIDKWLEKQFKFTEEERIHLLGARLSQIVFRYKFSLGFNS